MCIYIYIYIYIHIGVLTPGDLAAAEVSRVRAEYHLQYSTV